MTTSRDLVQFLHTLDLQERQKGDTPEKRSQRLKKMRDLHLNTDDDPNYHSGADDEDERWLMRQPFSSCLNSPQRRRASDAVLNCSLCFSLLTVDCQRHEVYKTQYRAMFVTNCRICFDEPMDNYSQGGQSAGHRELIEVSSSRQLLAEPRFWTVRCAECDCEVAAFEEGDEVYHFFNTFASH